MKKLLIIFSISLLLLGCNKSSTSTEEKELSFSWEVDTLDYGQAVYQILLESVVGISKDSFWVGGHSDDNDHQLFLWNGQELVRTDFIMGISFTIKKLALDNLNNLWIAGTSRIMDSESNAVVINNSSGSFEYKIFDNGRRCLDLWIDSQNNIYAGTIDGYVYSKKSQVWESRLVRSGLYIISIWGDDHENVYLTGAINDSLFLYEKSELGWDIINRTRNDYGRKFGNRVWGVNSEIKYSYGNDLYMYQNNDWIKVLVSKGWGFRCMYGNRIDNIFIGGPPNEVHHFDGEKWTEIEFFKSLQFDFVTGIWCDDEVVVIVGFSGNTSMVVKGEFIYN